MIAKNTNITEKEILEGPEGIRLENAILSRDSKDFKIDASIYATNLVNNRLLGYFRKSFNSKNEGTVYIDDPTSDDLIEGCHRSPTYLRVRKA